jgi:hypothetical protein
MRLQIAPESAIYVMPVSAKTITVNVFAVLGLYARMVFAYFSVRKKF